MTYERMEPATPTSPTPAAPIMASLFGITKTSLEVEMEIGNWPIEARVDTETEVGVGD